MAERAANRPNRVLPLNMASSSGQLEVVQYLVDQGALVEKEDTYGETPLHEASYNGHLNVVQYLVGQGAQIDKLDNDSCSPLHLASYSGHLEIVQYLVDQGAQVEKEESTEGRTPLHLASRSGHFEVVQYLVGQGALVEKEDTRGQTPLHWASETGHLNVVQYLVGQGAQIDKLDNDSCSPLHLASLDGHLEIVKYLVDQGAQPGAFQKGSKAPSGTAQSNNVSSDKDENKAGTSPAVADKKHKTESTPAKKPPQEGTKTMETKPASALHKGSEAPSEAAQSNKVSSDKDENKAGTSPTIAHKKPTPGSTPAKKPPQGGTKTMETKLASAEKVLQDIRKPGASTLKKSTSVGGTEKSGKGINAPKKPATKRKAKQKNDAIRKTRKMKLTFTQKNVRLHLNASESGTVRDNKTVGQEIHLTFN